MKELETELSKCKTTNNNLKTELAECKTKNVSSATEHTINNYNIGQMVVNGNEFKEFKN